MFIEYNKGVGNLELDDYIASNYHTDFYVDSPTFDMYVD